jgi:hypothetical protein
MRALGAACLVMAGMFVLTITLAVVLDKPAKPIQKPIQTERVIWI